MTDPLRLISTSAGASCVPAPGVQGASDPTRSFKDVLLESIGEVNSLQAEASRAAEDYALNRRDDLEGVILATQKADTAFKMLLSVRNKMQQAYEEIKQMRV